MNDPSSFFKYQANFHKLTKLKSTVSNLSKGESADQWGRGRKERGVQSGGIKNQPTSAFMSVTNWNWRESGDREKCSLRSNVGGWVLG